MPGRDRTFRGSPRRAGARFGSPLSLREWSSSLVGIAGLPVRRELKAWLLTLMLTGKRGAYLRVHHPRHRGNHRGGTPFRSTRTQTQSARRDRGDRRGNRARPQPVGFAAWRSRRSPVSRRRRPVSQDPGAAGPGVVHVHRRARTRRRAHPRSRAQGGHHLAVVDHPSVRARRRGDAGACTRCTTWWTASRCRCSP